MGELSVMGTDQHHAGLHMDDGGVARLFKAGGVQGFDDPAVTGGILLRSLLRVSLLPEFEE